MDNSCNGKDLSWRYRRFPLNTDPKEFGLFEDVVTLWQSKQHNKSLPYRKDMDILDFWNWRGKVAIVKFEDNPFNVRFVLWGTKLTEWWGVDYSQKLLGQEALNPEKWKKTEGRYFQEMIASPFIGLLDGQLEQYNRPYKNVVSVDLPLWDGNKISHVIMFHEILEINQRFEMLFPTTMGEMI